MGNLILDKPKFIGLMEKLKDQYEFDYQNSQYLTKIFPDSFLVSYNNGKLYEIIIELMSELGVSKDTLEYYIYELEWGSKYRTGMFTIDDQDFPLRTLDELWVVVNKL